jgi:DNA-binding SARP family transcriptional activator
MAYRVAGTPREAPMRIRILGQLEVEVAGQQVALGPPKQRLLLAVLLCHVGKPVPAGVLIEALWGSRPPPSATVKLRGYVHGLRRILGAERLSGRGQTGLVLDLTGWVIDAHRFDDLVDEGQQALAVAGPAQARLLLQDALALWRGPPFGGLDEHPALHAEAARLTERLLVAYEQRIEADLTLGRHAALVPELTELVDRYPFREGLCAQLMLALYRSGRQADALAAYRRAAGALAGELGVDPGPRLRLLHHAILTHDPDLDPPAAIGRQPPPAVPATLPPATADFTGRESALRRLTALLDLAESDTVPIAAVSGMAGVGKTALAIHFGHQVRHRFPDGQLFVNLRGHANTPPLAPVAALAQALHALGVPAEHAPDDVERATALYRSLLADRRVLVVLDDAERAQQVRPLLPGTPGCMVVVTSRERLSGLVALDGARQLSLDTLAPNESVDLLARILGRDRVAAEPEQAQALARLCAHLPLALRIVAAHLSDRPHHRLADYAARLRSADPLATLAVEGDRAGAIRPAFESSYVRLSGAARRLFRLVGLVPGPTVTVDAASALAGMGIADAARQLDRLAAAHLLTETPTGRFACHDLLRVYAADRASREDSAQDRALALARLYDWYVHTAAAAAHVLYPAVPRLPLPAGGTATTLDTRPAALDWLDEELPNLLAAIEHTAESGPRHVAWLLADTLRGYFRLRQHFVGWLAAAQAARSAAERENHTHALAAAELSLADASLCQARHPQAIEHYGRAVALAREVDWLPVQAAALNNLSRVYWLEGQLAQAARQLELALAIDRRTGSAAGQAIRLGNLGVIYHEMGQLSRAVDILEQALATVHETGQRSSEAICRSNLGIAYHELGQTGLGIEHLDTALAQAREAGDRGTEVQVLRLLAEAHIADGHLQEAHHAARAAVRLAGDAGDPQFEVDACNALGAVHFHRGEYPAAIEAYDRALRLGRRTDAYAEIVALTGLAEVNGRLSRLEDAQTCGQRALRLAAQAGYRLLEGRARTALAEISHAMGENGQAAEQARAALAVHRDTGHRGGETRTMVLLSTLEDYHPPAVGRPDGGGIAC